MNLILAENLKAIEAQVKECEDKVVAIKDKQKASKDAIKVAEKIKDLVASNEVISTFAPDITTQFDIIITGLNNENFDDEISVEKDKIKKLNKALLALQEIDN